MAGTRTDLLQDVFRKLCVFQGGFDLVAAERVTGATVFVPSTLVDKSLITRSGKDRFKFHELVRQYAQEELQSDEAEYRLILDKHSRYFASLMEAYKKKTKTDVSGMSEGIIKVQNDPDNFLAGWHHALDTPFLTEIGKCVFTISAWYPSRGFNSEAEQTFAQALSLLDANKLAGDVPTRMRVMVHYGWFLPARNQAALARQTLHEAYELSSGLDSSYTSDIGILYPSRSHTCPGTARAARLHSPGQVAGV